MIAITILTKFLHLDTKNSSLKQYSSNPSFYEQPRVCLILRIVGHLKISIVLAVLCVRVLEHHLQTIQILTITQD